MSIPYYMAMIHCGTYHAGGYGYFHPIPESPLGDEGRGGNIHIRPNDKCRNDIPTQKVASRPENHQN